MPKISALTAATTVNPTDSLVIVQSGTTKKAAASLIGTTARTAAEISAAVTPTAYQYAPLNVLRYGADRTGTADASAAFNAARSVQVANGGGTIIVPSGVYKVNLVITGENAKFQAEDDYYENGGTVGLIANNPASPVLQIGDGTTVTRGHRYVGFSFRGLSNATQGIRVYGANHIRFDKLSIRGFETYQIQLDSSATRPTFYVYFDGVDMATAAVTDALGIDYNYGASYTTSVFVSNSNLAASTGGGHIIDLENTCGIRLTNTWMSGHNGQGIRIRGESSRIVGAGVFLDSGSSSDVLVVMDFDGAVPTYIQGEIAIDGCVQMPAGTSVAQTGRGYIANRSVSRNLHILDAAHFANSSAARYLQHGNSDLPQRIIAVSSGLRILSTDGNVEVRIGPSGELIVREDATTAARPIRLGESGPLILTGTATPESAVTAPVGSLFLRSDGGTNTTLYVKESGTGNTGWVAK